MIEKLITIQNKLGLHTRAAAKLVATAAHFESKIQLKRNDQIIDAKSIMGAITLGASFGMILELIIDGPDELQAEEAITALINNRFGEKE